MTSDHRTAKALREFFEKQLMPAAESMKAEGVALLTVGREENAASYYVTRRKRSMLPADFEWGGCSVEAFPEQLAELWRAQGHEELVALTPALGRLAVALQGKDNEDAEVSPFIYVMF